jgi:hypothetical protein
MRIILLFMCAGLLACGSDDAPDPDASSSADDASMDDGALDDGDADMTDGGTTPDGAGMNDGPPFDAGLCGAMFCTTGQECCIGQGPPVCMTAGTCPM